jgi:hypothetical protein
MEIGLPMAATSETRGMQLSIRSTALTSTGFTLPGASKQPTSEQSRSTDLKPPR